MLLLYLLLLGRHLLRRHLRLRRARRLTRPGKTGSLRLRLSSSHLRALQTLPLPVARRHVTPRTRRAGVIASAATLALGRQAALAVLAAVDDILQALALARLRDLRPVQVLAGLGVVGDVGHGRGGDLALAAGAGACVEVRGGVDFRARGLVLHGGLVGRMVVLLGWGVMGVVLRGGGGGEGGDVGLEVGDLAWLGRWGLVDGVCFAVNG